MICFSKTGSDHVYTGVPCQDFATVIPKENYNSGKWVMDGCGSTPYADCGVKLFAQLLSSEHESQNDSCEFDSRIHKIFKRMNVLNNDNFVLNNLLFTILHVKETEDRFLTYTLGDGYLICQDYNDKLHYMDLGKSDIEGYPKYFGYNMIEDKSKIILYRESLRFVHIFIEKKDMKNVGVASDGLRFLLDLSEHDIERQRFEQFLIEGKEGKIKMLINRNPQIFKDDIAICF